VRRAGGATETLTAAWVIGADGAHSRVREAVGLQLEGSTYPETTILATTTFPFEAYLEGLSNVNYCWSAEGTFSLLRLPRLWRVSLYADEGEPVEQALHADAIEAKLQRIVPTGEPYEVLEARPYRIHQRIVADYRRGRVLLAGDAAHLNSPSGGMGMNGGLHDAFNLCEKLVRVWQGEDEGLLDLYGRQRRPIAREQILAQAHQNRTRMQERDPAKRLATLRDLQATAADPARAREYLLRTSMIAGLRQAAAIQ
jgi:3-(3-hydroxy-phenyl)propionate hydroxylase